MGPYYGKSPPLARAIEPADRQRMTIMNLSLTGSYGLDRAAAPADATPSPLYRLWSALRRRRWRRARPFIHMNDHLRRDIGLPPFDGGGWR